MNDHNQDPEVKGVDQIFECVHCGYMHPATAKFCPVTGESIDEDTIIPVSLPHPSQKSEKIQKFKISPLMVIGIIALIIVLGGILNPNFLQYPIETFRTVFGIKSGGFGLESGKDVIKVVYVSAGIFVMGSDSEYPDEKPIHEVYLDAFWIDQTEVTNARYAAFLNQLLSEITVVSNNHVFLGYEMISDLDCTDCDDWEDQITWDGSKFYALSAYQNHPVTMVNWYGAQAYCELTGRRLPTEAEWEKAARGKNSLIYPWGDNFDCKNGNFDDETIIDNYTVPGGEGCDGYDQAAPVGSFPEGVSPYGVLDLSGNVWEWVSDWYESNYYSGLISNNPIGPLYGTERVLRGGAWFDSDLSARSCSRHARPPNYFKNYIGFRCAHDAVQ